MCENTTLEGTCNVCVTFVTASVFGFHEKWTQLLVWLPVGLTIRHVWRSTRSSFFLSWLLFLKLCLCLGCFCGLGLVYSNKSCTMPPITFQDLPLNIYMIIFGTGIFVFILSLIFCCYFIRSEQQKLKYVIKTRTCPKTSHPLLWFIAKEVNVYHQKPRTLYPLVRNFKKGAKLGLAGAKTAKTFQQKSCVQT